MKSDQELLKIWNENEGQIVSGINACNDLPLNEKARIFDLIANGKNKK